MQDKLMIKKVAVLGAGVMGAQIAAHCVNANIETLLFDLPAKEGALNGIVQQAMTHLGKLKPPPLAMPVDKGGLIPCNYETDLAHLKTCDLVIEAIAERLDWKEALYKKISPYLAKEAILVSNTSGLSINELASVLPPALQSHFAGVHFFNPPRYMHLVELIPSAHTSPQLLDQLEAWLTSYLGKGIVRAKDTPNFIANRVGVFSLLMTLKHAAHFQLGLDEVDALTGTLLGRPKSATFRTMDVVGLDTMQHVVNTMQAQLQDDPWHAVFALPQWLERLIDQKHLGQKTGQGVYRKKGQTIEVYDVKSGAYRQASGKADAEVVTILKIKNKAERLQQLASSKHPQAQFLLACFRDLFHYSAYHLQAIAESVRDIDLALKWGYGWQEGPFETWEQFGVKAMQDLITTAIARQETLSVAPLPNWLHNLTAFYDPEGAYAPASHHYQARRDLPVYAKQLGTKLHATPLFENEGVVLRPLQDEVAVLSFKSKANTIDQFVIDGIHASLDYAEKACRGLIIYQQDAGNFSSGADLRSVAALIHQNQLDQLGNLIQSFQTVVMRLQHSLLPTVAAVRGRALGGGCELMLHCSAVVASFEAYPGLVELGVGLIPAGGGCKEMAKRAAQQSPQDLMVSIKTYFEHIAKGMVAGSASEAQAWGYLRPQDTWVMHTEEVLQAALAKINALSAANYRPPLPARFPVAGREGHAILQMGLVNWLKGGFISEHDYFLANELAKVLCGGDVNQGEWVDEQWMLQLEKETFVNLATMPATQARIGYLLETGKPLRN